MSKLVLAVVVLSLLVGASLGTFTRADERTPLADFKIRVWLDRSEQRIVLTCTEGCAWTEKVINCSSDSECSAEIHASGSVEPARSD